MNTRSSVDPFLTSSPRRDLREIVWRKFKSRGDNGDANDTKATITAIVRLRAERARLLGFASHAHWRMADTMAADPKTAQSFLLSVWPAVVARVKSESRQRCRPSPIRGPSRSSHGTASTTREKLRKAKYDVDEAEIKPYFELEQHGGRGAVVGRTAIRHRLQGNHRHRPRLSSRRARLGSGRLGHRRPSGAVLSRQLRAGGEAFRRVGLEPPDAVHNGWCGHVDCVEQQQLREGRAGRTGADFAGGRADAVSRVRPRAALDVAEREVPRPRSDSSRLRGAAFAVERAMAAQPRRARSFRAALSDRRADAAVARRQN